MIRKVTYNTDAFDQHNFEMRLNHLPSFNFDSGKIGKFIECEFETPIRLSYTKITSLETAHITFVI